MKHVLSMLVEIQSIDDALRDLREAKAQLEALLKENTETLEVFDGMLTETSGRISESRAFYTEKEAALNKNLTDPRPLLREKGLLPA